MFTQVHIEFHTIGLDQEESYSVFSNNLLASFRHSHHRFHLIQFLMHLYKQYSLEVLTASKNCHMVTTEALATQQLFGLQLIKIALK